MFRHPAAALRYNPFAVESARRAGAKGIAPAAGQEETDPDWQPL